ncbi:glyoxalase [Dyadobacter sp. CY356]|uniref:glyoxalase n=1 Tax=Dyadobacter sp. CY356 TaxID=2906442 RepID=UPI001F45082D|nr:glyoxalase [Dyadobacter sp. CY356]MCF0055825.1 glyoxalase [Dyadobacter sp. CY356]
MPDKSTQLLSLRPIIATTPTTGIAENFQNQTLRPILKLQNDLIVRVFKQYIHQRKNVFYKLGEVEQRTYISQALKQDQKFQQFLKGIIIGHFTDQEFDQFSSNEQEISKRLSNLLEQRLTSNLSELKRIDSVN